MRIPESILRQLPAGKWEENEIGMSGSKVWMFPDAVLKAEIRWEETETASRMLRWLKGKISVPEILAEESSDGVDFILMSRVKGKMSCDREYMTQPRRLTALLAKALKQLWEVDISGCPVDQRLEHKLRRAEFCVRHGLVDVENVEPETFGENGFRDTEELLNWLMENRPEETPVLSHGDFCLPNIFLEGEEVTGFIDLGRSGIADPWQDIALCWRSLCHNFDGRYGTAYPGFDPMMLFEELGMEPDWQKLRYYILLDELF